MELSKEQRNTLLRMKVGAEDLYRQMLYVNNLWDELLSLDIPTGFMDFQYPYTDTFVKEIEKVEIWTTDINNKITNIIHPAKKTNIP